MSSNTFAINMDLPKKKSIIDVMSLLPSKIERSDGSWGDFNPMLIRDSIMIETGLTIETSSEVTRATLRKLAGMSNNYNFTAPFIREIVCTTLSETGHKLERNKYTRLGVPVYDVGEMLKENSVDYVILKSAFQIISEYICLTKLDEKAVKVLETIQDCAIALGTDEMNNLRTEASIMISNLERKVNCRDSESSKCISSDNGKSTQQKDSLQL